MSSPAQLNSQIPISAPIPCPNRVEGSSQALLDPNVILPRAATLGRRQALYPLTAGLPQRRFRMHQNCRLVVESRSPAHPPKRCWIPFILCRAGEDRNDIPHL